MTAEVPRNLGGEEKLIRRIELRASPEKRKAIYAPVLDSSHTDIEYAALLILASLIALFVAERVFRPLPRANFVAT